MKKILKLPTAAAVLALTAQMAVAAPETVSGPGADPDCFASVSSDTKYFQWPAREGPFKIALVNGFIANDWRVQMIAVAKAYAEQDEVAADIEEFKVISVGEDIAAQIAAANNFIDQEFDAIIVNANNTAAFGGVVRKANEAGVIVLSFDNVIDDPMNVQINVDQKGIGYKAGEFLAGKTGGDEADLLFVRGPAGQPVDIARAEGFHAALEDTGRKFNVTEVVGNWNPGDAQKVTADAIAAGGMFDGIYVEAGSQGAAQAMIDAGKFIVPVVGEDENAFRLLCNEYHDKGMECQSGGTGPAQSAVTIKVALAALKGEVIPQQIALPTSFSFSPYEEGVEVFPDLPGSAFTGNNFPACNIGFTTEEIAAQDGKNN
ncbi:substrate-binding domain-containing protein [Roseibium sp. Sym1]|uniref:substrate-binding domain-containing protein n=1 Tax=Roseibium sp. Sym1 TaxID=3016006 RepID=UPI0022B3C6B4|nr:substrate-binding domain-containing protein [Roseibium sp. Sym1]